MHQTAALKMANSKIICILGVPRIGTSLIVKVLNLLGVYLSPEGHLRTDSGHNLKGYWEQAFIKELDHRILHRPGGSTHNPLTFQEGWESLPELDDLKHKARVVIRKDLSGAEVWGWKNPATCLTLPFWKQLLP